jgi:RNA-directed DNA polymerase
MGKVETWCQRMDTNQPLEVQLLRLNQILRGRCAHLRPGVSSATFAYLSAYTWARGDRMVAPQTPPDHLETTPPPLPRGRTVAGHNRTGAVQPGGVPTTRYRYRGAVIPAAWPVTG